MPCGKCIECKLNYSRRWATDLMLEKLYHEENSCWFITLTYDDGHIPINTWVNTETGEYTRGVSLNKRDLQNFWKTVRYHYRKYYKNHKLTYLNVGEYGSSITMRPHYHAIAFSLPINELKLEKIKNNEMGDPVYQCSELEKLWGKGNVIVGRVTWRSCAYVVRYALKKIKGIDKSFDIKCGRQPEFISMSQGIGRRFYEEHKEQIINTDSVPVMNAAAPERFIKWLKTIDPEKAEELKRERTTKAVHGQKIINTKTNMDAEAQRKAREETIENNFKDIREV